MEWVESVKKCVVTILSEDVYSLCEKNSDIRLCINTLRLQLNFKGKFDRRIIFVLDKIEELIYAIPKINAIYILKEEAIENGEAESATNEKVMKLLTSSAYLKFMNWLSKNEGYNLLVFKTNPRMFFNEVMSVSNEDAYGVAFNAVDMDLFEMIKDEFEDLQKELLRLTRIYLKSEWERVKHEAKYRRKYNEVKMLNALEAEYISHYGTETKRRTLSEQIAIVDSNN